MTPGITDTPGPSAGEPQRDKFCEKVDRALLEATQRYLRVCSSGGMSAKTRTAILSAVEEIINFRYLAVALAEQKLAPQASPAGRPAEHDNLRDNIGQVISDALTDTVDRYTGHMGFDPFNSYDIDAIADAVMAVLPAARIEAPTVEPAFHLRGYGDVSQSQLDYYALHRTLDGFATARIEALEAQVVELRSAAKEALRIFDWMERRSFYLDTDMAEVHSGLKTVLAKTEAAT